MTESLGLRRAVGGGSLVVRLGTTIRASAGSGAPARPVQVPSAHHETPTAVCGSASERLVLEN